MARVTMDDYRDEVTSFRDVTVITRGHVGVWTKTKWKYSKILSFYTQVFHRPCFSTGV